jgi:hypothetical protein
MQAIGQFFRRRPRWAAALAFGIPTAALTHVAWYPDARTNGIAPALTLGAGLAHAFAGAITGPRLVDSARTPTSAHAALLGAATSLLAVMIFAPVFAAYSSASGLRLPTPTGYLALSLFTGLFAFMAVGWALLVLSVAVGWALHRVAASARG